MKIKYNGNARIRIEGIGYVDPGAEITVGDSVGTGLLRSPAFSEVKSMKTRSEKKESGRKRLSGSPDTEPLKEQEEVTKNE